MGFRLNLTVFSDAGGAGRPVQSGLGPSACPHSVGDRTAALPGMTLLQLCCSILMTIVAHEEGCDLKKRDVANFSDAGHVLTCCYEGPEADNRGSSKQDACRRGANNLSRACSGNNTSGYGVFSTLYEYCLLLFAELSEYF